MMHHKLAGFGGQVRRFVFVILLLLPQQASASMENARFALHRKAYPAKAYTICTTYSPNSTGLPCNQYTITGPLDAAEIVYVVVADAGSEGVAGVTFGIDYAGRANQGSGIDPQYVTWTSCADGIQFPNTGPNGEFPAPGGGIRVIWTTCQNQVIGSHGVHAVIGSLYVYAYPPGDVLKVTPNNNASAGPELLVADCTGLTTNLLPLYPGGRVEDVLAKVGFGSGQASAYNPCAGLPNAIGQWGFDEASSGAGDGIVYDTSPAGHHGAINGAHYIPGIVGLGALHFDGSGDFVGIAAAGSSLQLVNSDYTISWWANPEDLSGIEKLVEMDDGLDHSGGYSAFIQDQYLTLAHDNGLDNTVAFKQISPCGWQHFAVVYSKAAGVRYFYIDGVPIDTVSVSGGALTTDGNDQLYFGAHEGGSQFYRGDLDDVRIYDRALMPGQIGLLLESAPLARPTVKQATADDHSTSLNIVFSMPVGGGAADPANYSVYPTAAPSSLIPILEVSVQDTVVTLLLNTPLTLPISYSLRIRNVQNLCGIPISFNSVAPIQIVDVDPPTLLFVSGYAGKDTVRVVFSEPIGPGGDEPSNYRIHPLGQPSDLIPVNSASTAGSTALLVLATPLAALNYALEVSNVQDLHGNTILPNSRISIIPAVPLLGEYATDLKLTKGNPGPQYQVLGDVHIASTATLTIEPGVKVLFPRNQDALNIGDYPSQSEIICDGRLIAIGTAQDSIVFQSAGTGLAGDWGQIKFIGSGQGIFEYSALRDARSGVAALPGSSVTLSRSVIQAMSLDALVNSGSMTVSDCAINNIGQRGAFASQGRLSMERCSFSRTGMEAVRQEGGFGNLDFLTVNMVGGFGTGNPKYDGIYSQNSSTAIRWNSINNCGAGGINVSGQVARGPVTGNKISSVGGIGIHLAESAQDSVRFCDITDCGSSGIFFENPGPGELVENCLVARAQDGIKSQGGSRLVIRYSTIVSCRGSGLYHHETGSGMQLSVRSTILVSNQGWGIRDEATATDDDIRFVDSWNNTQGQYSGTSCDSICLASNPLFANASAGDYRLISTSPLRIFGEGMTQMGRYGPDPNDVVGVDEVGGPELRLPLLNFPNPFVRSTTIAFNAEFEGSGKMEVFSVTGQMVRREDLDIVRGVNQVPFQRTELASGMYFYRVSWPGHALTSKMILVP